MSFVGYIRLQFIPYIVCKLDHNGWQIGARFSGAYLLLEFGAF